MRRERPSPPWTSSTPSRVGSDAAIPNIDLTQYAKSQTQFGLDLYKKASNSTSEDNIFFSPLSISFALGLLHLGAKGSSLEQLNSALHLDSALQQQFHTQQGLLLSTLESNKSYTLEIVNRLFGDRKYEFLQEYLDSSRECYGSELETVNFADNADGASALINEWVSNHTNGKITDLIGPGVLNSLTKLVLVNAIHFKGEWLHQFDNHLTEEDDFHVRSEETARVQFMKHIRTKLNHALVSDLHAQVLELPFAEDIAFYVVLPDHGNCLTSVETSLSSDLLASLTFIEKTVNVWLPRFKLDMKFKLKNHLKELGVEDLFLEGVADLSGIDGTTQLYVSDALHKAFIKLDEEGAEAAASTAVVVSLRSSLAHRPEEVVDFKANRPFLFYLKDLRTDLIYFMGRFKKP